MSFTPKLQLDDPEIERVSVVGWYDENNKKPAHSLRTMFVFSISGVISATFCLEITEMLGGFKIISSFI